MNRPSLPTILRAALPLAATCWLAAASAAPVRIPMTLVTAEGTGAAIGTVTATDTPKGLKLTPALHDLPPGPHGFHLHDKPSCAPGPDADKGGAPAAGFAAAGHFDPAHTGKHEGPEGAGHQGDLPALVVGSDGKASKPLVAPHLKAADLKGHALMIHAGGDNYADQPVKLGGGGARIACGVVD